MPSKRTSIALVGGFALAIATATPLIGEFEGKRNDPYRDIVGIQTVCYGETRVKMRRYTDEECLNMLKKAAGEYAEGVLRCTPSLQYRPYVLAAATSLSYNIGTSAYCRSTAAKLFNAERYKEGCNAFLRWNKAGGKTVKGLTRRREKEVRVCLTYL